MVSLAAPTASGLSPLAEPQIDGTANVHAFSNIIGDVRVGAYTLIAPGTSIRADEGAPFYIGVGVNIQDGVGIHGLDQKRILGDDGTEYSVWIGNQSTLAHKALVHGPAYIGQDCFIGFRSTVFNARVGAGCIVMMHALIQDVEVPAGRYVPSGAVITSQQQADRLPEVRPEDQQFVNHIVGTQPSTKREYHTVTRENLIPSSQSTNTGKTQNPERHQTHTIGNGGESPLNAQIVSQVRQLLAQGYRIGTEHADARRFRTSSWKPCAPIQSARESEVLAALEGCLAEHSGEYVRLLGIDTQAKRRVLEQIIQAPDGQVSLNGKSAAVPQNRSSASGSNGQRAGTVSVSGDWVNQVQQLVAQGYQIVTEHADARRFRTSSWLTGASIRTRNPNEATAAIQAVLKEYTGEYVRLIGVDAQAKRRVLEQIIQTPDNQPIQNGKAPSVPNRYATSGQSSSSASLSAEVVTQIRQLLAQGYRIATEHADARRFRTGSWTACAPIETTSESQVLAALNQCMAEHAGEYVRFLGIDTKAKRRVLEQIIQRPDSKPGTPSATVAPSSSSNATATTNRGSTATATQTLTSDVVSQVRQLLAQGYTVRAEYADARRFRTGSWKPCDPIQSKRDSEVLNSLEACLAQHRGEYVRLIGVDTKVKRRVLEQIIQSPN